MQTETWEPSRLRAALAFHRVTRSELALCLRARGFRYSTGSVNAWCREESSGPPHPAVIEAIAEVLPEMRR